jgi:hypothetical protein
VSTGAVRPFRSTTSCDRVAHLSLIPNGVCFFARGDSSAGAPAYRLFQAESPRGISPRGAHRSGREPLDSSGSCHPWRAAASPQTLEFLRLPVDPDDLRRVTCSLPSTAVTPLPVLQSSPPLVGASVRSASRFRRLCLFPYHRQPDCRVSELVKIRA